MLIEQLGENRDLQVLYGFFVMIKGIRESNEAEVLAILEDLRIFSRPNHGMLIAETGK